MCLSEAIVIVIVRTRNGEGERFKYINVRKESRMVARLPQQVFLLLVLVTGTTSETVQRAEQSSWTTGSSTPRVGAPATRLSHSTTPKADTSARTSSHGRNILDGFEETLLDVGMTVDPEVPISGNLHSSPAFSISDVKFSAHKRKKIKNSLHESEEESDVESVSSQDPEDGRNNNNESSQSKSKLTPERTWLRSNEKGIGFFSSSIVGSQADDELDSPAISESARMPASSSSLAALDASASAGNRIASASLHMKIDLNAVTAHSLRMSNTGNTLLQGRGKKIEDASLEIPCKRQEPEIVQALIVKTPLADNHDAINDSLNRKDKLPGRDDHKATVNASLDHEDMTEPSKKIDNQSVRHSISSSQFLAAKSTAAKLQLEKSDISRQEVRKIAGLSKVSRLDLTEEGTVSYFDVPPPRFLSTIATDRSPGNDAKNIHLSSDQARRRNFEWMTSERIPSRVTSWPTTAVGFPKRYARGTEGDQCEDFMVNDSSKREFYTPNYPNNYPPNVNCIRTLEAEKGMLLKLDFRDRFELESMTPLNDKIGECRFDYLEVRDGQYGFSNLLGVFCDKQFPPEIFSKSRHLWLRFHSDDTIEYRGFKAVWSTVPRPTRSGVAPEQEPCFRNVINDADVIVSMDDVQKEKKNAERYKVALDCLWVITAPAESRMQLTFDPFKLEKPNDCSANFLEVFDQRTEIPSRLKNFCGSMAETVHTTKNVVFVRFYLEPKAINGTFKSLITVVRDKTSTDKQRYYEKQPEGDNVGIEYSKNRLAARTLPFEADGTCYTETDTCMIHWIIEACRDDEYDCDDNTCIALSLRCNDRYNCRFLRDEDASMCGTTTDQFDSSRVIIILVVFSLMMFGMCFAFVFNCVRKLIRDHRIIREHIRQSRENRLDEIGRKTTPCPISLSRTDLRVQSSESPSVEIDSSKELIPTTLLGHEYAKELVLEMKYGAKEANDIHQSNNVSNATQERLQESTEELEMCDSSCQTRESLFEPRVLLATLPSPPFSTFGYRRDSEAQAGFSPQRRMTPQSDDRHRHRHQHPYHQHPTAEQSSEQSHQSYPSNSPPSRHPVSEQCSVCPSSTSREGSLVVCPKHNPIPAPPGWSLHDPPNVGPIESKRPEETGSTTYKRYQSPKPDRHPTRNHHHHHHQPVYSRQNTAGSGERYDSLIYGSTRASSNATSNASASNATTGSGSQSATPVCAQSDPRYRAEAVIEVDQKRPFSLESTKSAPDVIATH